MTKKYPHLNRYLLLPAGFCLALMLLGAVVCEAQKYSFSHYDIEDGLIESQVNNLALDNQHRLWVATNGGACSFDGKEYVPYTRQNGMPSNFVSTVFTEENGRVWFGTQNGLMCLDHKKLINYPVTAKLKNKRVTSIVKDSLGTIWFLMNHHLFKITRAKVQEQVIPDTGQTLSTCLAVNQTGKLFAAVYRKGIYYLDNGKWIKLIAFPFADKKMAVIKILFDRTDQDNLHLLTVNNIYTLKNSQLKLYEPALIASITSPLLAMEPDTSGNMWIGTVVGAYRIKNGQIMHFGSHNGLTDNPISEIYNDADNNLWLGSQGSGFYKYDGDRIVVFDKSQGMPVSEVVMSIVNGSGSQILLGTDGGGLMQYDGKKLLPVAMLDKNPETKKIQCLYKDKTGTVWIGSNRGGLWAYRNNAFTMVAESDIASINDITEDAQGTIWTATTLGCFYVKNNKMQRAEVTSFCSSVRVTGGDSVLVGTQDGIELLVNKNLDHHFKLDVIRTSAVFCMLNYKGMLLIGTDDRGLFIWDKATGAIKNYSVRDGLNSNTIYSLVVDDNDVIWVGNGRGVNRLRYNAGAKTFAVDQNRSTKSLILESNQDAALYFDHKVWIGTTKGMVVYDTSPADEKSTLPHVIIQSVKLIPQAKDNSRAVTITASNGISLAYGHSHISISFRGIFLKNPDAVAYRYQLTGLDSAYSLPVKNNTVDYPSLPPGQYTFRVKALNDAGQTSAGFASFSFTILPPFYQTTTFRFFSILFFILLGIGVQRYIHYHKIKRLRIIEATKREENLRIRQQTAEDFHDELGNKLTRITILSQLLDTKIESTKPDQKKLLEQIKQNASSLYSGTKDILWALDPQSDNLYEILNHIKDFGKELFLDTDIGFEFNGIDESLNRTKLPMEYSRNLPLIFKELLNNILKHAGATQVTVNLNSSQKDELVLSISDNGKGFDPEAARKGQGINNIKTRTSRVGGNIDIYSASGKGTLITLKIKLTG